MFVKGGGVVTAHAIILRFHSAAADAGETLDMQNYYFRYTLDSIGEIAFGHDIGSAL